MTKLKKHDLVAVYEDPYTCQKFEGNATLLSKGDYREPGFETWDVCFEGDDNGQVVFRAINLEHCKKVKKT